MDELTNSPFAVVTFIVAPAMLTNASSVLAMSTINRMLRTRERMAELYRKSEGGGLTEEQTTLILRQVDRVETQAILLLRAMRSIYVALGGFAGATLITLVAALLEQVHLQIWFRLITTAGFSLGALGVGALILGTLNLFRATRISLANISEEAAAIRAHQQRRREALAKS